MPSEEKSKTVNKDLQGRAQGIMIAPSPDDLSEVVVVGYGMQSRAQSDTISYELANNNISHRIVPRGGWQDFRSYIEKHKSDSVANNSLIGKEIVEFSIDTQGRPVNITVRQSISPSHDAAVIRLLSDGASWQVVRGKKRSIRLTIIY